MTYYGVILINFYVQLYSAYNAIKRRSTPETHDDVRAKWASGPIRFFTL
jgi:hypothetical protein